MPNAQPRGITRVLPLGILLGKLVAGSHADILKVIFSHILGQTDSSFEEKISTTWFKVKMS